MRRGRWWLPRCSCRVKSVPRKTFPGRRRHWGFGPRRPDAGLPGRPPGSASAVRRTAELVLAHLKTKERIKDLKAEARQPVGQPRLDLRGNQPAAPADPEPEDLQERRGPGPGGLGVDGGGGAGRRPGDPIGAGRCARRVAASRRPAARPLLLTRGECPIDDRQFADLIAHLAPRPAAISRWWSTGRSPPSPTGLAREVRQMIAGRPGRRARTFSAGWRR